MASTSSPPPPPQPSSTHNPSPSSPTHQPPEIDPPMATPLLLVPATAVVAPPSSRRLPPPCWSPEETSALLDAYRDKWYSLRRANLRASHWQEVAEDLHQRCPHASPPKTPVQCRHKMEKLRKRYRAEIRRATSLPQHRFSSSWVYFPRMDSMEKGPNPVPLSSLPVATAISVAPAEDLNALGEDGGAEEDDDDDIPGFGSGYGRDFNRDYQKNGLRIKVAGNSGFANPNPSYGYKSRYASINSFNSQTPSQFEENTPMMMMKSKKKVRLGKRERGEEAAMEMVEAIRMMGEGLVRMEKMKMEMMRETQRMRMEMEMKRTEMILESQHRIVEAFAKAWSDNH